MIILPGMVIPRRKGPIDPIAHGMYPREVGVYKNRRWLPGWTESVLGWFMPREMSLGWMCYHTKNSARSQKGFPDLVCAHTVTGRTLYAELKVETGTVDDDQAAWLMTLAVKNEVYLWRPSDEHEITDLIQQEHDLAFALTS